jgi:hypothetical protein
MGYDQEDCISTGLQARIVIRMHLCKPEFQVHGSFLINMDQEYLENWVFKSIYPFRVCLVIVDNQKCPFYEVVKMCNGLNHCVPLIEMVKKTYMEHPIWSPDERVMPPRKCMNYRYYRSEKVWRRYELPVILVRDRYYRWMVVGGAVWRENELPVVPVLPWPVLLVGTGGTTSGA